jgi:hypothetical protein
MGIVVASSDDPTPFRWHYQFWTGATESPAGIQRGAVWMSDYSASMAPDSISWIAARRFWRCFWINIDRLSVQARCRSGVQDAGPLLSENLTRYPDPFSPAEFKTGVPAG